MTKIELRSHSRNLVLATDAKSTGVGGGGGEFWKSYEGTLLGMRKDLTLDEEMFFAKFLKMFAWSI